MNRKVVTAIFALSAVLAISALAQAQSSTGKHAGLTNPGFEEPILPPPEKYRSPPTIPGWKTTDTHFEIWGTGFMGVAAHEDTQFVELNYLKHGKLFQDSTGIEKGTILEFTFAHRGRNGEDKMKLTITDLGADNKLNGGDDTVLFEKEYTTGNKAWRVYDHKKEKQIVALGNNIQFAYEAISTATGELGEGNLLDAANFGIGVVSMQKETPIVSVSAGEVHIKTPDGLCYDFQGTGEFLCAQSDDKKAIVQSRQEPWPGNPTLSINTAAAISADGNKFEFYLKPKFRWFVNNEEQPAPGANGGGNLSFPGGTNLKYPVLEPGQVKYIIYWGDNSFATRVLVTESSSISYMDIGIRRDSVAHTYQGMFGNIDKDPQNDMTLRNGEIVTPPASIIDLNRFTDSWRLTTEESLFGDAQRDKNKEALAKSSHTEVQIPKDKWDAAETEVKGAGITSPIVVRNATYDVALTGDKSFIESAKLNDAAVKSLPPAERTVVAGDAANQVAVDAQNKLNAGTQPGGNALLLAPGSAMNVKQKYWSENKEFYAIFQPDGNFGVATRNDGYRWDIVTKKKTPLYAKKLILDPTGNLVFLDQNDKPIWSIEKLIKPVANSTLNISNSGDLLLIGPDGAVLWDSSK